MWDPANDAHLAARFDVNRLHDRSANKTAIQQQFGLDADPARLLFGVVSRLTAQKGIDLLLEVLPTLIAGGAQLVLLGSGDPSLAAGLNAAVTQIIQVMSACGWATTNRWRI